MIRVSFSGKALNIDLPKGWGELSQKELEIVYSYADRSQDDLALLFFIRACRIRVVRKIDEGWLCVLPFEKKKIRIFLTVEKLIWITEQLSWLGEPGNVPVRLDRMRKVEAVNARLYGLSFGDWLRIENYYQGFLLSQNIDAVKSIAKILYPGLKDCSLESSEQLNVLNWVVQAKNMFAAEFKWLFTSGENTVDHPSMLEIMNNQIRILTGGDITREEEVRACDCWRALTELNFKAKESEDFKKDLKKNGR